jgi:hypothetical protein
MGLSVSTTADRVRVYDGRELMVLSIAGLQEAIQQAADKSTVQMFRLSSKRQDEDWPDTFATKDLEELLELQAAGRRPVTCEDYVDPNDICIDAGSSASGPREITFTRSRSCQVSER